VLTITVDSHSAMHIKFINLLPQQ